MGRMTRLAPFTLAALFLAATTCIHGQSMEPQEYELVTHLLQDYFPLVRPVANHRDVIDVFMDMTLVEIVNMDEENQIMVTSVRMYQQWRDVNLQWDPKNFYNITQITLPSTAIWKPDIVLYNNANDNLEGGIRQTRALVDSDGTVTWKTLAILMSACEMNPLFFPFDIQNCSLKFGSWTFHGDQINLQLNVTSADTSMFQVNGEWDLIGMPATREVSYYPCCPEHAYPIVTFYVLLERRSLFYMVNLVLPCVLIASIVLLGFFLPSDAGEKITLTITILLALTVFLLLVSETIPPTSEVIPLIGQFYASIIVLVGICAALTVIVLSIHHRGDSTHVPRWVHTLFLVKLATLLRVRNQISQSSMELELHGPSEADVSSVSPRGGVLNPIFEGDDGIEEQHQQQDDGAERRRSLAEKEGSAMERQLSTGGDSSIIEQYITSISKNVSYFVRQGREEDKSQKIATEWQEVAMVLDRLFMVVFTFLIALVALSTLLAAALRVPLL
ncbi:neuronal acetylcholine receptor subunit alpha-10-like [Acanthaster planci]|uniref:Neuronal acetylcholine receptor subunit alpha-10-like n=1 Tax=Acanthaster planci TaxID=133434 RepID=A0A8B8A3A3_ACAPL|nr:neuronal acetylcholine receptor subunit alpha-10-like [Acanthaster planci]